MKFRGAKRSIVHVDLTPMIDVTFMLLIFFLVTAQMAAHTRGEVRLPVQVGEPAAARDTGMLVMVRADGSLSVGEARVDAAQLTELARKTVASGMERPPVVRADRDAPAAALNLVARALQAGGIPSFQLATQHEAAP